MPVLTKLSPITNNNAMRIILGSLNPESASAGVNMPVMVIAVIVSRAIISILNLLNENNKIAIKSKKQTVISGQYSII